MNVLFLIAHTGHLRNFASTLLALDGRGHTTLVAAGPADADESDGLAASLVEEASSLRIQQLAQPPPSLKGRTSRAAALALESLRYDDPFFADAPRLRERARSYVPPPLRVVLRAGGARRSTRRVLRAVLQRLREAAPDPHAVELLGAAAPDVMVLTPLVDFGSWQAPYVRAARAAGIPTVLCVASWDNLTTKGLIHDTPDLVAVWNEEMRAEAIDLHCVPPDNVRITGAPSYDQWSERRPKLTREHLLASAGLDPHGPYVLYVGSSPFVAPDEGRAVLRWLTRLRTSPVPALRSLQVLVRPHPLNPIEIVGDPAAAPWPPRPENPTSDLTRSRYFESIYHASGVVGINTSAMVEAAVIGRRVLTVLDSGHRETQLGSPHFRHLAGFVRVAETWDDHARHLSDALGAEGASDAAERAAVERFTRPPTGGRATDAVADVIEEAASAGGRLLSLAPSNGGLQ